MSGAHSRGAPRAIAVFAHDAHESTVRKRVSAFQACGWSVDGFTFTRVRPPQAGPAPAPFWRDVPLGATRDRNYAARLPRLAAALPRILRHRRALRKAHALYARNIDMLVLAAAAKALTGARGRLVYEVLDVQRPFLARGPSGALLRFAERRLLARSGLLVVSAPDFIERYFVPVQRYRGPWFLLENKIDAGRLARAPSRSPPGAVSPSLEGPLVLGWFGVLRCARSLALLDRIAERLGERVRVVLRGRVSPEDIPPEKLEAVLARRPNIVHGGPYANPDDLAALYGGVHLAWAVDYTDAGTNSDWLLPNRLYEGGYYGAPAIARARTAAGRKVEALGLGVALPEPLEEEACAYLVGCDLRDLARRRAEILALPASLFVDETDTAALLERIAPGARQA
ncbi:glucosyl transferase [Salinarimonas sp.]|uniref:glucosyl transferase n=1 Tax=Salinarimonas sp. TaxID=2766526 RepID=UPI0032D904A6